MPVDRFVVQNEADGLRQKSDALLVVVIMAESVVYSGDPRLQPKEAARLLSEEAPNVAEHLALRRGKRARR